LNGITQCTFFPVEHNAPQPTPLPPAPLDFPNIPFVKTARPGES